jgi:hypothetical protein
MSWWKPDNVSKLSIGKAMDSESPAGHRRGSLGADPLEQQARSQGASMLEKGLGIKIARVKS